jgi:carboxymethylenebutenolidase
MTAVPGAVTDESRVTAGPVTYRNGDVEIEAYLARPTLPGPRPAVLVIHEAFGPNDHIHDLARRFANAGFDALAPNLYTRAGMPTPNDMDSVLEKMWGTPDGQVVSDLDAGAAYLRSLDDASGKVGCVGFCSGGRQTLLFAVSSTAVDAAVDCWGGFIDRATADDLTTDARPTPIIDMVANLACPLLAVGGAEDQNPSPEVLAELAKRLDALGKDATVKVFEDAGHAFLADYRPSYREGPAHELWPQIVAFFDRHLR